MKFCSWRTYSMPLDGGTSRPSMKQCTYTFLSPCCLARRISANRCSMWLCTPPSLSRPIRCRSPPDCLQLAIAFRNASLVKKSPSLMDLVMRVSS